ncbi:Expansin-A7 [Ananas comosus]|uniref:Expansin-A7 n=1 Tax=Ananas comosus TaxID=4615 RepID=A0A199UI38_ANACO|nr:Expansin-A7 [Ananas comosus]
MHEERGATIYVPAGSRSTRFQGNAYWLLVYVMNVGGGGDGSNTGWISMTHNWGVSYQAFAALAGQSLSFKITSYATRDTVVAWHVAPPDWSRQLLLKRTCSSSSETKIDGRLMMVLRKKRAESHHVMPIHADVQSTIHLELVFVIRHCRSTTLFKSCT